MFWQLFNSWRPGGTQQFEPLSHSLKPAIYGLRTHFDAIDFGFWVFSDFRKRHGAMKKSLLLNSFNLGGSRQQYVAWTLDQRSSRTFMTPTTSTHCSSGHMGLLCSLQQQPVTHYERRWYIRLISPIISWCLSLLYSNGIPTNLKKNIYIYPHGDRVRPRQNLSGKCKTKQKGADCLLTSAVMNPYLSHLITLM